MPAAILKSHEEIALLLIMKPAKTEKGRAVQARVLARVEIALAIEESLKSAA